jgi:neutral ceramidase
MVTRASSLLAVVLLAAIACHCTADEVAWKAGTAKEKITPPGPMWMAGYGSRNHPATGLLNDLWARALVLQDVRGARVAIVSLDLVGIGREMSDPLAAELGSKFGLDRAHVVLACSHTHSGPVVGRNLHVMHYDLIDANEKRLADEFAAALHAKIVDAVGRAIANLAPARLAWGHGTVTFAVNRRNNKEADAPRLREEGKLTGPFDHDVPVLKITDMAGKPTGILFGYACHATVLDGYDWSSDYPGFAADELEQRHAGATALFLAGCGADQNPLPRRRVELARQYGHELAVAVDAVLNHKLQDVVGTLDARAGEIPLALAHVPTADELLADAASQDKFIASRARSLQELTAAGREIPATYPYPIQVWRLGDTLTLVTLGGEVVVDYAIRLKGEHGPQRTWVAGYANDVMAYIPSRRVLAEGGYEGGGAMVYYGLPSPWAETVEEDIVKAVRGLMTRSK